MRTIQAAVYKFNELTEEAKNKAINELCDINILDIWWNDTYEDASNIGLEITSFSLDRANYCNGRFVNCAEETAENIIKEHGEECETYKTAKSYLENRGILAEKYSEDNYEEFDYKVNKLDENFLNALLNDYKDILKEEYEYLQSDESIIETIESNEYEFTVDGKMYEEVKNV